jgi:hypothetical protein
VFLSLFLSLSLSLSLSAGKMLMELFATSAREELRCFLCHDNFVQKVTSRVALCYSESNNLAESVSREADLSWGFCSTKFLHHIQNFSFL